MFSSYAILLINNYKEIKKTERVLFCLSDIRIGKFPFNYYPQTSSSSSSRQIIAFIDCNFCDGIFLQPVPLLNVCVSYPNNFMKC